MFQDRPFSTATADLIVNLSEDQVGAGHYTVKRNWRRRDGRDVRREGHKYFAPKAGDVGNQPFPNTPDVDEPITLEVTARRPNGQTAFICATPTRVFRYFALEDGDYVATAGSDTPYVETTGANTPYVSSYDGTWLVIGEGFDATAHRWEAINLNGYLVLNNGTDLPVTYRLEHFEVEPIYELREQGIAYVGSICEFNGCLFCFDVAEIFEDYLPTLLGGADPYGSFTDSSKINRIGYRTIWSGLAEPRRWAASVPGAIEAGSRVLTLDYAVRSIRAGDEIMVAGAGLSGGDLTTKVLLISSGGLTLSLADPASTTVEDAPVALADANQLITGAYELEDDSSMILRGVVVDGTLVALKDTGFFLGVYTGDAANPFEFTQVSAGKHESVFWRWTAIAVQGSVLLYAGRTRFYTFDLATRKPRPHAKLSRCDKLFFKAVRTQDAEMVFAADNGVTKEIWICFPGLGTDKVLAWDYEGDSVSTLDEAYTAAATVVRPIVGAQEGPSENWFVMGTATGALLQYGLTADSEGVPMSDAIYTRLDANYVSEIQSGREGFGDRYNAKALRGYVLLLATDSASAAAEVTLYGAVNPGSALVTQWTKTLPDPHTGNLVPCNQVAHYYKDRIRVVDSGENVEIVERVFDVDLVEEASAARA